MPVSATPGRLDRHMDDSARSVDSLVVQSVLIPYIRHALGLHTAELPEPAGPEWHDFCDQMMRHRVGGLVGPVLTNGERAVPREVEEWLRGWRDMTSRLCAANLLTMRRILPRLEQAGIPVLVFKGPVLQQMAYGTVFHRPSSDLDLLVAFADFDRAGRVLGEAGYALASVCRSLWWKLGLGEQHFGSSDVAAVTLDLHHRVQQPGCPLPLRPERFFQHRLVLSTAGQEVPTLSQVHSTLLAAMSFAKAIHHREPALRYLLDFVALVRGRAQTPWSQITAEAEMQGLTNTVGLAVRSAGVVLGGDALPMAEPGRMLGRVTDDVLRRLVLAPEDPSIPWPKRRDLLLALYDRKSGYPGGLAAMVGSDLLRRAARAERSGPRNEGATS